MSGKIIHARCADVPREATIDKIPPVIGKQKKLLILVEIVKFFKMEFW